MEQFPRQGGMTKGLEKKKGGPCKMGTTTGKKRGCCWGDVWGGGGREWLGECGLLIVGFGGGIPVISL